MTLNTTESLLRKYDKPGPRYTSYPTVPVWSAEFGEAGYREALAGLARRNGAELSVYLHLPYCAKRCHYCGCNSLPGRGPKMVDDYLDCVEDEVASIRDAAGGKPRVAQIHWGGGTPNYLRQHQVSRALEMIRRAFEVIEDAEISLEADPRLGSPEQAAKLREAGFNRVSLGVQDFDAAVQKAIGRNQSEEQTRKFYHACRAAGFSSVNMDLVYGLPGQTPESFARTLAVVQELAPDRLACFSYAHVPWVKPNQKFIDTNLLPPQDVKFSFFQRAVTTLTEAGYVWLGMDHFAKSEDELALAYSERRLHRNFMGYTTAVASDVLALGMSGISDVSGCYAQNSADLTTYQKTASKGGLPIVRGFRLSGDDKLRRRVITHLMCNMELPYALTTGEFGAPVDELFAAEIERMDQFVDDGLLAIEPDRLQVTNLGRFFVRNICMEFDAYLERDNEKQLFSRTV